MTVFINRPVQMQIEISHVIKTRAVGRGELLGVGGGAAVQHSTLKIYHSFTFSQTDTQGRNLNTGQSLLNNLTWSHLYWDFSTINIAQALGDNRHVETMFDAF